MDPEGAHGRNSFFSSPALTGGPMIEQLTGRDSLFQRPWAPSSSATHELPSGPEGRHLRDRDRDATTSSLPGAPALGERPAGGLGPRGHAVSGAATSSSR